jgi:hypothetical protein
MGDSGFDIQHHQNKGEGRKEKGREGKGLEGKVERQKCIHSIL